MPSIPGPQARDICVRLERPGAPTDLFLRPAPTEAELAAAKHQIEQTLEGVAEEDMAPAPARLPEPPPAAPAAPAPAGRAAGGGGTGPAAKGPAGAGKGAAAPAGGAAGAASAAAPKEQQCAAPAGLDWRAASTWSGLAALLDVGGGYQGIDPLLGAWLADRLAARGCAKRPVGGGPSG